MNLPEDEENDEAFFEANHKALTEKSIIGVSPSQRVRYYAIFNKIYEIMSRNIQNLTSAYKSGGCISNLQKLNLLKCLLCENDILRVCKDLKSIKITPVFLEMMNYACEFDHIVTLYLNASLHFRRMDIHAEDLESHTSIIFHAVTFMKLFEVYDYDAGLMYFWHKLTQNEENSPKNRKYQNENKRNNFRFLRIDKTTGSPQIFKYQNKKSIEEGQTLKKDLQDKVQKLFKYGKEVLEALNNKDLEYAIFPKFIADEIIEKNNLSIQAGSHHYYILIAEIVITHYILSNKIEDLIIILTTIQSFFGNSKFIFSSNIFSNREFLLEL